MTSTSTGWLGAILDTARKDGAAEAHARIEALEAALRPFATRGHDAIVRERAVAKGQLPDEHKLHVRTTVREVNAASDALREPGAGNGTIDNVSVYGRVLTDGEIAEAYERGK